MSRLTLLIKHRTIWANYQRMAQNSAIHFAPIVTFWKQSVLITLTRMVILYIVSFLQTSFFFNGSVVKFSEVQIRWLNIYFMYIFSIIRISTASMTISKVVYSFLTTGHGVFHCPHSSMISLIMWLCDDFMECVA